MTVQSNKKRKHDDSSQHSDQMIDSDDQNIESVLFDEMTSVNSQLISLASKVKLVDSRYFMHNSIMIDEFIDNIHEFLKQVDIHRKKVSSKALSSDNLFSVFQFLDSNTVVKTCRYVSTLWKDAADKIDLNLVVGRNIESLVKSPAILNVTSLKLTDAIVNSYQTLAKKNVDFTKLKSLDLSGQNLIMSSVKHLTKCNMPNLTELNLSSLTKFQKDEADVLFKSKFMKGILKLDISQNNSCMDACQHVDQITHLTYRHDYYSYFNTKYDLEPLVKDKRDLEYLSVYFLQYSPILTSSRIYTKLSCLNMFYCDISKEDFVSLIICKNLPSLRTLVCEERQSRNFRDLNSTVVNFPPNSQSSITDLRLHNFYMEPFPTLTDHCPNLKSLTFVAGNWKHFTNDILLNYLNSNSLSNLESLHINCWNEAMKIILTSPTFSNLKELWLESGRDEENLDQLFMNCTNLENLRKLHVTQKLSKECLQSLKTHHPIFSKVHIY